MDTKKAAVLIVMACVITPMLVGYAWPDERTERIGWESGESHDITSSIKTSPIATYALDRTIITASWSPAGNGHLELHTGVVSPPSETSEVELSQWILGLVGFTDLEGMIEDSELNGATVVASVSVESEPVPPVMPVAPSALVPTSIVTPGEYVNWTDVGTLYTASCKWESGELEEWSANGWVVTEDTPAWDTRDILVKNVQNSNFTYRIDVRYTIPATSDGPLVQIRLPTPSISGTIGMSLTNVSASTTTLHTIDNEVQLITTIGAGGVISAQIITPDDSIDTGPIGTTSTISWIRWMWDLNADTVSFATMTGDIGSGQVFEIRSYDVDINLSSVGSWYAETSSTEWKPQIVTYDNLIRAGTTLGILNATIRGNEYYPDGSWQIQIKGPSTIGHTIGIAGVSYDIVGGDIVVDGQEMPIRNLTVFAAGNGDGTSSVYVNGVLIATNVASPFVTLGGTWNTSVILSDMDSYTYWTYSKDAGGFGLDVVGFCTVGLITSIGAFLAAVVAGRRSGGRFALLALVAGICAAFFLLMISNNLNL